jgi:primosomal replication protein N
LRVSDFNRLSLDACLIEKTSIRKNLTGVPVVEVLLQHSSDQTENGGARQTQFEINAVAMGEVALTLEDCTVGAYYRVQGFLNRKSLKSVKLRLHITHITPIHSSS